MPVFIAKYNEHKESNNRETPDALLGTIVIPRNLSLLNGQLPKAQYDPKKIELEDSPVFVTKSQRNKPADMDSYPQQNFQIQPT